MSSFTDRHLMYLFSLKNGKKKLAYGKTPEDALDILSIRLSEEEMSEIEKDDYIQVKQTDLQEYVPLLG